MKTRIIQTRFWDDEFIVDADKNTRYLFLYLLTSQYINLCSIFQLNDKKILFETGLSVEEFKKAKTELEEHKKALFCEGWVFVVNAFKNNRYCRIKTCALAYENEFSRIPKKVINSFDSTMGTSIYNMQKEEIKKMKEEKETSKIKNNDFPSSSNQTIGMVERAEKKLSDKFAM